MSIFDYFRWNQQHEYKGPNIKFGRYSDAFKDEVKQSFSAQISRLVAANKAQLEAQIKVSHINP